VKALKIKRGKKHAKRGNVLDHENESGHSACFCEKKKALRNVLGGKKGVKDFGFRFAPWQVEATFLP